MCGISGIFVDVKYLQTDILKIFKKIIHSKNKNISKESYIKINEIFKNESLYFNFFSNKNFKKQFLIYKNQVLKIIKKSDLKDKDDLVFLLEIEFKDKIIFIEKYLNSELSFNKISFLFNLSFIINSINLIEVRGRDSLGLSMKINIKNFDKKITSSKNLVNISKFDDITEISYLYKTFNLIGGIGDNSSNIVNQIFNDKSLINLINSHSQITNFFFHAHTRWASKGRVNLGNCHPIQNYTKKDFKHQKIHLSVNGDITNSENLLTIKSNMKNSSCTSDTVGFVNLLSSQDFFDNTLLKKQLNKAEGSFCFVLEDLKNKKIYIGKSGNQGLYLSFAKNKLIYSSDIYGFIEISNKYISIPNGFFYELNQNANNLNFFIFEKFKNNDDPNFLNVNKNKLSISPIGFRDVYKGAYEHYFLKELIETKDVVNKTLQNFNYLNYQFKNFLNTPSSKLNKNHFVDFTKKYDEIIITGMGTCYTAAVAISQNIRSSLRKKGILIDVEPHIASEGSAFYIKNDMSRTLVIVIAQSGTTIDTNIYVELASKRGAKTLAIVNKRDGDLTFLVDNVIYIGDGRDIEISVPSTKTYIAHIFLAEIFMIYLFRINNLISQNEEVSKFNSLNKKEKLLSKFIKQVIKIQIHEKVLNEFLKRDQWIISYNDYKSEALAQEIRIKFSESCYTVIPILKYDFLVNSNYKNALIILVNGKMKNKNSNKLSSSNFIINIGKDNLIKSNFHLPVKKSYDLIYDYILVIYGQYLSYQVAKQINNRLNYFQKRGSQYRLKNINDIRYFNKGYSNKQKKLLSKGYVNQDLINQTIRPIDTIKHQAKTITVGATRNTFKNDELFSIKNIDKKGNIIKYENRFVYIYFKNGDESDKNFLINHLNDNKVNNSINIYFKICKHIDYGLIKNKKKKNIIVLNKNEKENNFKILYKNNLLVYDIKNENDINDVSNKINLMKISNVIKELFFKNDNDLKKSLRKNNYELDFLKKFNKDLQKVNYKKLSNLIRNNSNIKFIGSGTNYSSCKEGALNINSSLSINIAWDVLENHKHIDISSEPLLFVFISNIKNFGYQLDAITEIEKFISHNNKVIIITSKSDKRFFKSKYIKEVIYLPDTTESINQIMISMIIGNLIKYLLRSS